MTCQQFFRNLHWTGASLQKRRGAGAPAFGSRHFPMKPGVIALPLIELYAVHPGGVGFRTDDMLHSHKLLQRTSILPMTTTGTKFADRKSIMAVQE